MQKDKIDVLVVNAHPDDCEMAVGGSLLKLAKAGKKILNLCLTKSQKSTYGDVESRAEEFEQACKYLGCQGIMLDYEDTELSNTKQARDEVVEIIRKYRPQIVMAPYHTNNLAEPKGIANVDHYQAGSIARDAVKLARLKKVLPELPEWEVKKMFFFMLPTNILPTIYVDVTDVAQEIKELISCYKSQLAINTPSGEVLNMLMKMRLVCGFRAGCEYAEGFVTEQPIMFESNHFFEV